MQAAGSVDHPLPPQSDTGGWGSVTGGRGQTIQVGGAGSQVGGVRPYRWVGLGPPDVMSLHSTHIVQLVCKWSVCIYT